MYCLHVKLVHLNFKDVERQTLYFKMIRGGANQTSLPTMTANPHHPSVVGFICQRINFDFLYVYTTAIRVNV